MLISLRLRFREGFFVSLVSNRELFRGTCCCSASAGCVYRHQATAHPASPVDHWNMIDVGCLNPTSQQRIGQPEHLFVTHTERFDQMSEAQPSSSSLSAMQALAGRIIAQTPHLRVLDLVESPYPFVRVK